VNGSSLISSCEASEVLELVEAPLDPIAMFVADGIMGNYDLPRSVGGNDGFSAAGFDNGAQCVAVIGFVGKNCLCGQAVKQSWRGCDVTGLTGRYDKPDRATKRVGQQVYLGC